MQAFWANQHQVIMPSWLRKNALCLSQSVFINFALHVKSVVMVVSWPLFRKVPLCLKIAWQTYQYFKLLPKLLLFRLAPLQFLAQWPSCPHLKQAPDPAPLPPPLPLPLQLFCGTNSPRDFMICFQAFLLCADPLIPPPRRRYERCFMLSLWKLSLTRPDDALSDNK